MRNINNIITGILAGILLTNAVCALPSMEQPSISLKTSAAVNDKNGEVISNLCFRQDSTYYLLGYLEPEKDYMVVHSCADKTLTEISIPEHINGIINKNEAVLDVKRIHEGAFMECENLTNVHLPETMEHIDRVSFYKCYQLTNINLPDSVDFIGEYAFAYTDLKNISLPASLKTLETYAFGACDYIESYEIAEENEYFTTQGGVLFNKEMDKLILYPVNASEENYTIPASVKTIEKGAFLFAKNLKTITLPENILQINEGAFQQKLARNPPPL